MNQRTRELHQQLVERIRLKFGKGEEEPLHNDPKTFDDIIESMATLVMGVVLGCYPKEDPLDYFRVLRKSHPLPASESFEDESFEEFFARDLWDAAEKVISDHCERRNQRN